VPGTKGQNPQSWYAVCFFAFEKKATPAIGFENTWVMPSLRKGAFPELE